MPGKRKPLPHFEVWISSDSGDRGSRPPLAARVVNGFCYPPGDAHPFDVPEEKCIRMAPGEWALVGPPGPRAWKWQEEDRERAVQVALLVGGTVQRIEP